MSRKPIFQGQDLKQSQLFQTGRTADTRVPGQKQDLSFIPFEEKTPFSGFTTASQSIDNTELQSTVSRINEENTKYQQLNDNKIKDLQYQLDQVKQIVYEQKGNQVLLLKEIENSVGSKIQRAQEQLMQHQENFQSNYQQKLNEFTLLIDNNSVLFENKLKSCSNKIDKLEKDSNIKADILNDAINEQFKYYKNESNLTLIQSIKRIQDEFDHKLVGIQQQINEKTFNESKSPVKQANASQQDINKLQGQFSELLSTIQLLQSQINDHSNKIDLISYNGKKFDGQLQKLEKNLQENLEDIEIQQKQTSKEISQLQNQISVINQNIQKEQQNIVITSQRQLDEIKKSQQDLLFSFKQQQTQFDWVQEYNRQLAQVSQQKVQIYNYDEDAENNEPNENRPIEQIRTESDVVEFQDRKPDQSQVSEFKSIEELPSQHDPAQDNLNFVPKGPEDTCDEEEEEVTYQIDENGYLMDDDGNYILDENANMIKLSESQIEFLRQQKMVEEQ
ncbi:hypothetical protein pb186bvf_011434 [Paramecium bursaria]